MACTTLIINLAPQKPNPSPRYNESTKPNTTHSHSQRPQISIHKPNSHRHEMRIFRSSTANSAVIVSKKEEEHNLPKSNKYAALLQVCTNMESLKQTHAHVLKNGMHQDMFLSTKFLNLYAEYGSIEDSRHMFDEMPDRNASLWKVMIRKYCTMGLYREALKLYCGMLEVGDRADSFIFSLVLKASSALKDVKLGKVIHGHVVRNGFGLDVYAGTALVDMYAKCRNVEVLSQLFNKMSERNVVSWNAMIAGYTQNGCNEDALRIFLEMLKEEHLKPDFVSVVSVLPSLTCLRQVRWVHGYAIRCGFESNVTIGNALVAMYARWGDIKAARRIFDTMSQRDVVSWNSVIGGCVKSGYFEEALGIFNDMCLYVFKPDSVTIVNVLGACNQLPDAKYGKCIHGYIIRSGFEANIAVENCLITMYAKHGEIADARMVFDNLSERSVISWNAMISGYAQNGFANEVIMLFSQMHLEELLPNSVTVLSVVQACAHLTDPLRVRWIHGYIIRNGLNSDIAVENTLISCYSKCNSVKDAHKVFDELPIKNVISYNALIAGYAQNGLGNEGLTLYQQMKFEHLIPDSGTMVNVLQSCSKSTDVKQGKLIHGYVIKCGFELDVTVGNALVSMYANCGRIEFASQVFDQMCNRDLVSWNAIIAGYTQNDCPQKALIIFQEVIFANIKPNSITIVNVLQTCSHLAALQQGKRIHGYVIRNGFMSDASVVTGLIDMYAKCGSLEVSCRLFDKISDKDVVSWSAMINAYGIHGYGKSALRLFRQMQATNVKPNDVTFVSILSACSHAGLLDEGLQFFDCMIREYGITPRMEHYTCIVDLLGRSGHFEKAQEFIENMPTEPSASVWRALLGACRIYSNIELGKQVATRIFSLEPEKIGSYVLLSNIYAAAGRWDDAEEVRHKMNDIGLKKRPGCSWIEINCKVYTFLVNDKSHPQSDEIYALLESLQLQMTEIGYIPNTDFVLHDVEEEVKEQMLSSHSEKLAISFGLINTKPGTPIRITKNLRVCGDCHTATKFISKITTREIIMRDLNRFHYFNNGLCSCGDYW